MSMTALALACIAGFSFAIIGVTYKYGDAVKIPPAQIIFFGALTGMVVFAAVGWSSISVAPWYLPLGGFIAGISQYGAVKFCRTALRFGPLSPMWSALMLAFVPTIIYSSIILGEPFSMWNAGALLAAILAVTAASLNVDGSAANGKREWKTTLLYGLILITILACNAFNGCIMKHFGTLSSLDGKPLIERCGMYYVAMLYLGMALFIGLDLTVGKSWNFKPRRWPLLVLGCTYGTMVGMALQTYLIRYPAAHTFTAVNSSSLLMTAVLSAILFHEKRTLWWYVTIVATLCAIVFVNLESLFT